MSNQNYLHADTTQKLIKAFYRVYNTLGYGFLEKVYQNAMLIELEYMGFQVEKHKEIKVFYNDQPVGTYYADIMVDEKVIIELKAAKTLCLQHECQLIN